MAAPDGVERTDGTLSVPEGPPPFYRRWRARGQVPCVIVHGIGEHSGRYEETATRLARAGLVVYAADLPGHGRSPGARGHVASFDDYLAWVGTMVRHAATQHGGQRPVLLGHSLGGLIATWYAADRGETLRGVALSSPFWGFGMPVPWWQRVSARRLAAWWPALTMRRPRSRGNRLSHDPQVVAQFDRDPLVHRVASVRLYAEILDRLRRLPEALGRLRVPVLVLQAGEDQIGSVAAVRRLFPLIAAPQRRLEVYEGYYHEVLNEIGRERVLQDLLAWVAPLCGTAPAA